MLEEAVPHQYVSLTFLVYVYMVMQLLCCFRRCYYAGNEGGPCRITRQAKFRWPKSWSISLLVHFVLCSIELRSVLMRCNWSHGSHASMSKVSKMIPKYSSTVVGPIVLWEAMGMQSLSNRPKRLSIVAAASACGWSIVRKSSRRYNRQSIPQLLWAIHAIAFERWSNIFGLERQPNVKRLKSKYCSCHFIM